MGRWDVVLPFLAPGRGATPPQSSQRDRASSVNRTQQELLEQVKTCLDPLVGSKSYFGGLLLELS